MYSSDLGILAVCGYVSRVVKPPLSDQHTSFPRGGKEGGGAYYMKRVDSTVIFELFGIASRLRALVSYPQVSISLDNLFEAGPEH